MPPGPASSRHGFRTGVAIVGILVVATVLLIFLRRGDDGDPVDSTDGSAPVRTGLEGIGIAVYGDSWAAPGGWHTPGRHWSQLLDARTDMGRLANFGLGGATMEDTVTYVTGSARGAWTVTPDPPILAIVMSVANSALVPDGEPASLDRSLTSLRAAALSVGARMLSDEYAEDDGQSSLAGDWTEESGAAFAGDSIRRTTDGSVTFTVPDGVQGRMLWMSTLAGDESVTYEVTRDGGSDEVATPIAESSDKIGFTKWFLPIGTVDAGDSITVRNVTGEFFYDGMYIDNGQNRVAFATEPARFNTSFHPVFNDEERIDAHNEALRDAVEELNDLVPGGATLIDLDEAPGWNPTTMTFRDDEIHPDDTGQDWIFDIVARRVREIVQEGDPRLDP